MRTWPRKPAAASCSKWFQSPMVIAFWSKPKSASSVSRSSNCLRGHGSGSTTTNTIWRLHNRSGWNIAVTLYYSRSSNTTCWASTVSTSPPLLDMDKLCATRWVRNQMWTCFYQNYYHLNCLQSCRKKISIFGFCHFFKQTKTLS